MLIWHEFLDKAIMSQLQAQISKRQKIMIRINKFHQMNGQLQDT